MDNCSNPLYARGYCLYHYKTNYLAKNIAQKPRQRIRHRSDKRAVYELAYKNEKNRFIIEEKEKDSHKRVFCYFCSQPINGLPSLHHKDGRDNEKLLDKSRWALAHFGCHDDYHHKSWKFLSWWKEFLERLKTHDENQYEKEFIKMLK